MMTTIDHNMEYRLVKRARGWAVQQKPGAPSEGTICAALEHMKAKWKTVGRHRFHFLAAFHLAWLREWAR